MAALMQMLVNFQEKVAAQSEQDALFYEALLAKLKNPPVPAPATDYAATDYADLVMNIPVPTAIIETMSATIETISETTETMSDTSIETISNTNTVMLQNASVTS